MTDTESNEFAWALETQFPGEPPGLEHSYLLGLIETLKAHPRGLRRWSVMRLIRKARQIAGAPIPHKMEDGIERIFRAHCANSETYKKGGCAPDNALFHWPQERAGEVWAVYSEKADAWLASVHPAKPYPDAVPVKASFTAS